MVVFIKKSLKS